MSIHPQLGGGGARGNILHAASANLAKRVVDLNTISLKSDYSKQQDSSFCGNLISKAILGSDIFYWTSTMVGRDFR